MTQITLPATEKSLVETVTEKTARLFFVDHLRASLVILVVLHHLAVVYGAVAAFYYVEFPINSPLAFLVFLIFALSNQAWFMGALFLIAGYFTPGSYDRKGSASFLKGRLVRLGIPLLFFFFVLGPLSSVGYWQMPASMTGITEPLTWRAYPFLVGMGPMWFVALLLIFDFGYAAWRRLTRDRASSSMNEPSTPGYLGIGIFILALALVTYLFRIIIPMGKEVLDFPTLAYLPQYLSLFVVGTVAYRRDWFRTVPGSMGGIGFVAVLLATLFLFPLALSGRLFSLELIEPAGFVGNGTWHSAVYALWDSIFAVGMCLAAITFFRRFFNRQSQFGTFLSQQSYAVYLIHTPIVVFVAIALKGTNLGPFLKFALAAVIVLPVCFVAAYLIRKIPGVSRVL
jgi:glucan biosynthesis protein C